MTLNLVQTNWVWNTQSSPMGILLHFIMKHVQGVYIKMAVDRQNGRLKQYLYEIKHLYVCVSYRQYATTYDRLGVCS